jgi:hypothetical protein
MPTPTIGEPIHKVTLNIYAADYHELKRLYGDGWSVRVREIIRDRLRIQRGVTAASRERENV